MQEKQETGVRFLNLDDPLEKKMATHPSVIGWEIPWTEEPGGLQSMSLQRIRHDYTYTHTCTQADVQVIACRAKSFVIKNLIQRSQHISSFWPALYELAKLYENPNTSNNLHMVILIYNER